MVRKKRNKPSYRKETFMQNKPIARTQRLQVLTSHFKYTEAEAWQSNFTWSVWHKNLRRNSGITFFYWSYHFSAIFLVLPHQAALVLSYKMYSIMSQAFSSRRPHPYVLIWTWPYSMTTFWTAQQCYLNLPGPMQHVASCGDVQPMESLLG